MMNFDIADYIYELVNGPLAIMNIVMNLFFAFCLSCPARHMKEIQQPLKMLLGSLIFATTVFLLALFVDEILSELQSKYADYFDEVVSFTASTSLSTTVWLNFFYYTQIVPAHEVIHMHVKRNIKTIIYSVLFVDRLFFLLEFSVRIFADFKGYNFSSSAITRTNDTIIGVYYTYLVCSYFEMIYEFFYLCLMVGSSWATMCYLRRHIKTMKQNGCPFSSPNLATKIRVTVAGIVQAILYFLCALWTFAYFICNHYSSISFGYNAYYTVISFYMFGTTVNLGIGQIVFRHRVVSLFLKVKRAIRPLPLCD